MDYLKRELAPVSEAAWKSIDDDAIATLSGNLSGRYAVDFDGPHGYQLSSVNTGRLAAQDSSEYPGIRFGIRRIQPLLEVRASFRLLTSELDEAARGAEDLDTEPVIAAALRLAEFEERAVYYGLASAGIAGLMGSEAHVAVPLGEHPAAYPESVARAILRLSEAGIGGPYVLVLESQIYRMLAGDLSAYPPLPSIEKLTGGPVLHSPVLNGGVVLSRRGGDYRLSVGQDFAIGYQAHDGLSVDLYLTETFTFRMLAPEAVIRLTRNAS
ncbi:MAG TPA: family 1 encapsulin nanocompartment shell protein [Polyangiaceae bacterium]|nr:family 1 encapsulin nanocompartment shell protein [Polyangiaceae bacterium]